MAGGGWTATGCCSGLGGPHRRWMWRSGDPHFYAGSIRKTARNAARHSGLRKATHPYSKLHCKQGESPMECHQQRPPASCCCLNIAPRPQVHAAQPLHVFQLKLCLRRSFFYLTGQLLVYARASRLTSAALINSANKWGGGNNSAYQMQVQSEARTRLTSQGLQCLRAGQLLKFYGSHSRTMMCAWSQVKMVVQGYPHHSRLQE